MKNTYCFLTGGQCAHIINLRDNSFFIGEPYDEERKEREDVIINALTNYKYIIADHYPTNASFSCKICRQIKECEYGIVDLTGFNRNVLIELGILFGLNKPTIIAIKRGEESLKIPSNIIGIEQIRYSNYGELYDKIKKSINVMIKGKKFIRPELLHIIPQIIQLIKEIEIKLFLLDNHILQSRILDVKIIEDELILIIDKGEENGILPGLVFDVIEIVDLEKTEKKIEHIVGSLEVVYVQNNISQTKLYEHNPDNSFWDSIFTDKKIMPHILRTKEPPNFEYYNQAALKNRLENLKLIINHSK